MHANAVASEQVGVGVLAESMEDIHAEWLSVSLYAPMAAVNHCGFRTSPETGEARFNRVRQKSVIGVEERDVSRMSEMKAEVARACEPAVALAKQYDLQELCQERRRADV